MKLITTSLLVLFGTLLGLLTVLLLPVLFLIALEQFILATREPRVVRCDAGNEGDPSPTAEAAQAQIKAETRLWRKLKEIEDLTSDRSADA
jgi:hypothetical protein